MASHRRSGSKPKPQTSDQARKERSGKHWLKHPLTIALVPVILTAFFVYIQNRPTSPSPKIELDDVQVTSADTAHSTDGTRTLISKIYFSLRNTGNQLAIIRSVRMKVEHFTQIPICYAQGDLPTTGNYNAELPLHPRLGSVIGIHVSQQAPIDSADRFEISLRIPPDLSETIYVYQLRISLFYDNLSTPLDAGDVILAMPFDPGNNYYLWTRAYRANQARPFYYMGKEITEITKCMVGNSQKLRSFLSLPGIRSQGLASLPSIMSYCCAVNFATEVPSLGVAWDANQKGYGQPQPSVIYDGNDPLSMVTNIHWKSWGSQTAVGEGTALYAPGTTTSSHSAQARVVAFNLGLCNGSRSYMAIEWYFPQYGQTFNSKSSRNSCTGQYRR